MVTPRPALGIPRKRLVPLTVILRHHTKSNYQLWTPTSLQQEFLVHVFRSASELVRSLASNRLLVQAVGDDTLFKECMVHFITTKVVQTEGISPTLLKSPTETLRTSITTHRPTFASCFLNQYFPPLQPSSSFRRPPQQLMFHCTFSGHI